MSRPPPEPPPEPPRQGPNQPPSQPRISDDGKFYWDGQRWLPMPAAQPKEFIITAARPKSSALNTCVGLIGLAFVLLLFLFIGGLWCGSGTTTT